MFEKWIWNIPNIMCPCLPTNVNKNNLVSANNLPSLTPVKMTSNCCPGGCQGSGTCSKCQSSFTKESLALEIIDLLSKRHLSLDDTYHQITSVLWTVFNTATKTDTPDFTKKMIIEYRKGNISLEKFCVDLIDHLSFKYETSSFDNLQYQLDVLLNNKPVVSMSIGYMCHVPPMNDGKWLYCDGSWQKQSDYMELYHVLNMANTLQTDNKIDPVSGSYQLYFKLPDSKQYIKALN